MEGFDFPVEIVRTDRKRSVSIQLEQQTVKIRVPENLSEQRIRSIIQKRAQWIETKLKEISERPAFKPKEFVSGEGFTYLGRNYRLKVLSGDVPSIKLQAGYLQATVRMDEEEERVQGSVRSLLIHWYQEQALISLREKTQRFGDMIGVCPKSVKIKDYKSRWGSCSIDGDISYNWRIILAPDHVVNYVVVHELCHMLEHNHSRRYWKHVECFAPDWKAHRDWLKQHSQSLQF